MDIEDAVLVPQEGRGPVHAGSASHSAHRIRRSSSPTLTNTKAASSLPVFDPANMAGTPYAFLTVALLAIATPDEFCCAIGGGDGYQRRVTAAAINRPEKTGTSNGDANHSRKSNLMGFDI